MENLKPGLPVVQTSVSQQSSKFKENLKNWFGLIRRNSAKTLSLLVSVLILVVGLTLVQQQQRYRGKADVLGTCLPIQKEEFGKKPDPTQGRSEIEELNKRTRELSQDIEAFKKAPASQKRDIGPKLFALTSLRKSGLVKAMRKDPETALNSILLGQEDMQPLLPNCLEREEALEGSLEVFHADFFEDGVSDTIYTLSTQDGRKIQLHPAGFMYVGLESGTKVRVKGIIIDDEMVFDASQPIQDQNFRGGINVISQPGNPPVEGNQRTAFLLVNFRNTSQPSLTPGQISDFTANSLNPYYLENSFNRITVTGDVFGWYTLPIDQTCSYYTVLTQAVSAANNDVYFPNYSRIVIIAPYGPGCGWAGMATIGKTSVSTGDGTVLISQAWIYSSYGTNLLVVGHELGHNFGNHHATFLDCGDVTIADSGCSISEYGDPYDILGNTRAFHFNDPHKEYVGWFEAANILAVSQSGTYILEPIETRTSSLKALKIQRKTYDYLYVEYRQPIGYDIITSPTTNIYQGALLHSLLSANKSALLDPTPLDSKSTITLTVGSSFTDPATGTQVTVTDKTSNSLTVNVTLGKTDFISPNLLITSPTAGSTVSGIVPVTADASDQSGIQKIEFYLDTTAPSGLISTDLNAPYGFSWNTTGVTNGQHTLVAKAYDRSGEPWGVPGNFTIKTVGVYVSNEVISTPTPTPTPRPTPTSILSPTPTSLPTPTPVQDTTPPTVSITNPQDGATVSRNTTVNISASASDNVGVARVEFSVDGGLKCTDTIVPYTCSWRVTGKRGVTYIIQARAYDSAGNTAFQNITVTSQ